MYHLLEFLHSEYEYILYVYIQMLQSWLMISPTKNIYTVYTVLFHKNGGVNSAVKNWMSQFSMFVPTKAVVKLANGNTVHAQGVGIILCRFPNFSIIYPVEWVCYCTGHPSKTISSGALIFYAIFLRLHLNIFNIVTLLTLEVVIGDNHTRLKKILTIFNSKFSGSTLTETRILLYQLYVDFQNKVSLNLFISFLVMSLSLY